VMVFLNARASYGRAKVLWERVRPELEGRVGKFRVVAIESPESAAEALRRAVADGERVFVAAGGDGTVNLLVNAAMSLDAEDDVTLGALGLGSSNDFHKPLEDRVRIAGVPSRIRCEEARLQDVIRIDYDDGVGGGGTRFAIANASLGITAEANACFNAPTPLVRAARKVSVNAAIVASVLVTLSRYTDIGCRLRIDGEDLGEFPVSNLGVVKSPHFAGSFCYDASVGHDDGRLGVHLCERLTSLEALAALAALSRRRFGGRPKTRSWTARRVAVEGDRAFALETDGEILYARSAEFTVHERKLRCCV